MMNEDQGSREETLCLPNRILAVAYNDLCRVAGSHLMGCRSSVLPASREKRRLLLQDLLFHLESMVFLDGEHRADSLMECLLHWSGPSFTQRFFQPQTVLNEESFQTDLRYITNQVEELLHLSHYQKLPNNAVEKALHDMSFEKIFVRLQNVDFLNYYVRGSYIASQKETITRTMAKRLQNRSPLISSFLCPDSVEVYEEVVVIASEEIQRDEMAQDTKSTLGHDEISERRVNAEKMEKELVIHLQEEKQKSIRPGGRRRRAIQQVVREKIRSLQGKTLEDIVQEHNPDPNRLKRLHLLIFHNIPATDLELLIPHAEISLGVKEYIQLCCTGSATIPAVGRILFNKGLRKIFMIFNPLFYGLYRIFYKINVVRTEQRYSHARYLLNHRLARGTKAVSHLVDDYENVLKREMILIYTLLASEKKGRGLTREQLEKHASQFVHFHFHVEFEPDFRCALPILQRWGIVTPVHNSDPLRFTVPPLEKLRENTAITRDNLSGKICMG